jgi:hypothetical protein
MDQSKGKGSRPVFEKKLWEASVAMASPGWEPSECPDVVSGFLRETVISLESPSAMPRQS